MTHTTRQVVVELLTRLGVDRTVGPEPFSGEFRHLRIDESDLACLVADADGRLRGGFGAAWLPGGILHLSSQPGGQTQLHSVESLEELLSLAAPLTGVFTPFATAFHLTFDLDEPAAVSMADLAPPRELVLTADPELRHLDLAVVVGTGVLRAGDVEALLSTATVLGIPVVNTWGAKGVLRWDSPFHAGTAGLQARDWELAGVADAELVIHAGVDPNEFDPAGLEVMSLELHPAQLRAAFTGWPTRPVRQRPPLYDTIAAVVGPLYESDGSPLRAPRAALHLAGAAPDRAVVVADVDPAGFWVARTFPTGVPGSVVVPSIGETGFAAAATLALRSAGVPGIGVTTDPDDPTTAAALAAAQRLGCGLALQHWCPDGDVATVDAHVAASLAGFGANEASVTTVAVDLDPADLVAAAGAVDQRFGF
jgi:hypothetical protein